MTRRIVAATLLVVLLAPAAAFARARTILVYLPDSPAESAKKLAESATALAERLSAQTGMELEAKLFRRYEDATDYWSASASDVVIVFATAELVGDLPDEAGPGPVFRVTRGTRGTYRRVVIVAQQDGARDLADLRGQTVSAVQAPGQRGRDYLEQVILGSRISLGSLGALEPVTDDLTSVANVLTKKTAAAIVAEYNPLLEENAGSLRRIHTSPPISLPVLRVRNQGLQPEERAALAEALASAEVRPAFGMLGFDGIEALGERSIARLLEPPAEVSTPGAMEIARVPWSRIAPRPAPEPFALPVSLGLMLNPDPIEIPFPVD